MPLDFQFLGDCYNVAVALHRLTGLPLCVLYGFRGPEFAKSPEFILIHVGVLHQGLFVDETGIQMEPRYLLKEFIKMNEPYEETKILNFDSYEDPQFIKILSQTGAQLSSDRIEFFMEWIKNHSDKFHGLPFFSLPD